MPVEEIEAMEKVIETAREFLTARHVDRHKVERELYDAYTALKELRNGGKDD